MKRYCLYLINGLFVAFFSLIPFLFLFLFFEDIFHMVLTLTNDINTKINFTATIRMKNDNEFMMERPTGDRKLGRLSDFSRMEAKA